MLSLSNLERQQQISALVEREGKISIPGLCQQFQISEATARRDLETLAAQGKLRRYHGGALAVETAPPERPLTERSAEQAAEKLRIGRAAAASGTRRSDDFSGQRHDRPRAGPLPG